MNARKQKHANFCCWSLIEILSLIHSAHDVYSPLKLISNTRIINKLFTKSKRIQLEQHKKSVRWTVNAHYIIRWKSFLLFRDIIYLPLHRFSVFKIYDNSEILFYKCIGVVLSLHHKLSNVVRIQLNQTHSWHIDSWCTKKSLEFIQKWQFLMWFQLINFCYKNHAFTCKIIIFDITLHSAMHTHHIQINVTHRSRHRHKSKWYKWENQLFSVQHLRLGHTHTLNQSKAGFQIICVKSSQEEQIPISHRWRLKFHEIIVFSLAFLGIEQFFCFSFNFVPSHINWNSVTESWVNMVVSDREHNLLAVSSSGSKHNSDIGDNELRIQFIWQGRTW